MKKEYKITVEGSTGKTLLEVKADSKSETTETSRQTLMI